MRAYMIVMAALGTAASAFVHDSQAGTFRVVRVMSGVLGDADPVSGLAWDGQYLWTLIAPGEHFPLPMTPRLVALRPSDGREAFSFEYGFDANDRVLSWDGVSLGVTYVGDAERRDYGSPAGVYPDRLVRYRRDGAELGELVLPYSPDAVTRGVAWDGICLWLSDSKHRELLQVDPTDMSIVKTLASPGPMPASLAWDGRFLWSLDWADDAVYQMDTSGRVLDRWDMPIRDPVGFVFDGRDFWALDARKYSPFGYPAELVQLAVPEPSVIVLLATAILTGISAACWYRKRGF